MLSLPLVLLFAIDPGPTCTAKDLKPVLADVDFTVIAGSRSLVAAEGKLWAATCGPEAKPRLDELRADLPIDFRRYVPLPDGRLVFGGSGGLVVMDPTTLQTQPLTTADTYHAVERCWTVADGKPVVGWDRDPRPGGKAGEIQFSRGGPCGYEGAPTSTMMVVDVATRAVRPTVNVPALLVTSGGPVLVGDGGVSCQDHQTRGTLFVWRPIIAELSASVLDPQDPMGVVGLAETDDGVLWALTGLCDNGGAARGGDLFRADVRDVTADALLFSQFKPRWVPVAVPLQKDERGADDGQAILAIVARRNELHVGRAQADSDKLKWQYTKDGGKTWRPSKIKAPKPKVGKDTAQAIGVVRVHGEAKNKLGETWAWTDDGAWLKGKAKDSPWVRVFPAP